MYGGLHQQTTYHQVYKQSIRLDESKYDRCLQLWIHETCIIITFKWSVVLRWTSGFEPSRRSYMTVSTWRFS